MPENLAHRYSTESAISIEHHHDRVWMVFQNLCVFVLWTKTASALEGLNRIYSSNNILVFNP